jgi:hypothetical protein
LAQKDENSSPILKIQNRQDASPMLSSFQLGSTSNLHQKQLQMVPSETVIVPPLTIQHSGRMPEQLSSRSNRDQAVIRQVNQSQILHQAPPQYVFPHPSQLTHSQNYQPQISFKHNPPIHAPIYHNFAPFPQQTFTPSLPFNPKPIQIPHQTPSINFTPPPFTFKDIYNRKSE